MMNMNLLRWLIKLDGNPVQVAKVEYYFGVISHLLKYQ